MNTSTISRYPLASGIALGLATGFLAAAPAHAGLTSALTPSFRGSPCARFAGFETFTQAYNAPNAPDVAGSDAPNVAITQLVAGAILTSGGNLYHPFQAQAFRLTDTQPTDVQEVVFQTSTYGNAPDSGSFTLTYVDANQVDVVLPPTEYVPLVQLTQQHDELYFRWDLTSVAGTVLSYRIEWMASAPNLSFDAGLLDVRLACDPGSAFCAGDGGAAACPCGNAGLVGRGCANSIELAGARLLGSGTASLAADTLVLAGDGMPNSTCLYFQGTAPQNGGFGAAFGDGLRCVGGTIARLGTTLNAGGASSYPDASQASVSVRGAIPTAGTTAYYQVWYRNAAAFCTASTFNLSNGYQVSWLP